jgi:hypothetical protein
MHSAPRSLFLHVVLLLGVFAPSLASAAAPAKRLLLDNDGNSTFSTLSPDFKRDIDEVVASCPPNITTYLLCPGAGRYYYPTQVGETDPRCTQLALEHAQGRDPFGYFLQRLKAAGKETFVTIRTNDVHEPTAANEWNLPRVRREHPDVIVDAAAVARGDTDWRNWCLDYSRPEVRTFMLAIIAELLEKYEFDGVQLDWMRFPRHLSGTRDEVWAKRTHITDFVAEVRALCRKKNRQLIVRVPTSIAGCRELGLDVVTWTQRGLVDAISTSHFLNTDFFQPLAEMRAALGQTAVPIYGGFDLEHGAQRHSPESLRAAVSGLYDSGADGINIFNFPCWIEKIGAVPYDWLIGLESPTTAARKPLLYSVPTVRFRRAYELPGLLPAKLPAGATVTLPLPLPVAAWPIARARILVTGVPHALKELTVKLNGQTLEWLPLQKSPELFVEFVGPGDLPGRRPAPEASRTYRFDPAWLRAGANVLEITNASTTAAEVLTVNLGVW